MTRSKSWVFNCAVQLNNIGTALLQHRRIPEAKSALKDSLLILQRGLSPDNSSNEWDANDNVIDERFSRAQKSLADCFPRDNEVVKVNCEEKNWALKADDIATIVSTSLQQREYHQLFECSAISIDWGSDSSSSAAEMETSIILYNIAMASSCNLPLSVRDQTSSLRLLEMSLSVLLSIQLAERPRQIYMPFAILLVAKIIPLVSTLRNSSDALYYTRIFSYLTNIFELTIANIRDECAAAAA